MIALRSLCGLAIVAACHSPGAAQEERQWKEKPSDAQVMAWAREAVTRSLRDPESARFSYLMRTTGQTSKGEPREVVCGLVNSKNGFGGYAGDTMFIYYVGANQAGVAKDHYQAAILLKWCKPPTKGSGAPTGPTKESHP